MVTVTHRMSAPQSAPTGTEKRCNQAGVGEGLTSSQVFAAVIHGLDGWPGEGMKGVRGSDSGGSRFA